MKNMFESAFNESLNKELDKESNPGVMHLKKIAAQKAGEDSFKLGDKEFPVKEELKGGQKKLDVAAPYGKLTSADFAKLRAGKKGMAKEGSKEELLFGKKKLDKEGNEFTGKLAAAKAAGKDSFEIDGKTVEVKERHMTPGEKKKASSLHKKLPTSAFTKQYGKKEGEKIKYATATKMAMHKENMALDVEARRRPAPAPEPTPEPTDADVWQKSLDKDSNPADFDAATNPALKLDTEGVQKAREWIKKLEDMATFINGMDENSLNSQINALEMRNSIPFKGIVRRKEKQITDIAEKLRALAELFKTVVTGSQKKIHDATAR